MSHIDLDLDHSITKLASYALIMRLIYNSRQRIKNSFIHSTIHSAGTLEFYYILSSNKLVGETFLLPRALLLAFKK